MLIRGVKQILKNIFISIFAFSLILGGYYLFHEIMSSPNLQISNLEIRGNYVLQEGQVRRLVEDGVLGKNIFRADTRLILDRLSNNSWIETATVSKKIPNSLEIKIKERIPFAKIEMTDGKIFLIDKKTFLIKRIEDQEYEVLPTILLNNNTDYRIGSPLKTDEIESCIEFIEKIFDLKDSDHIVNFTSITMEEGDRYILKTPSADIRLSERRLKGNLDNLRIALRIIQQENLKVKFIDLTFNDQVVLKLI